MSPSDAFTLLTQPDSQPKGNPTMSTQPASPAAELTTADFQQLDHLDEEQMLAEFRGELLEQFVYAFTNNGRQVTGISWPGIKQLASRMGTVQTELLQLVESREGWAVVVKTIGPDSASRLGAAFQPKLMTVKGDDVEDHFALPKAVSKAQRNAIRALLPETLVAEAIKAWMAEYRPSAGNGNGGNGHKPALPPASGNGQAHSFGAKAGLTVEAARALVAPEGTLKGQKLGDLDRATWQVIISPAYKPATPEGARFKQAAALLLRQAN